MYKKAFELSYKNKKVEIEIQDFVGDVRNINGTEDLFSLSYISDSKDKGQSILVTEADINFYADDYFNIDELKTVGETDIKVKYYENDALLWSGFVIPDFFSTSVDIAPVVSMVATDRVGTLKEISNNAESNIPIQILASCLKQTGQDLPINIIADNNHFETPIQLERIDEIASYDVIRSFMVLFNCKITLYKNAWWVVNKKLLENGFINYKSYNSDGAGGSITSFAQPILNIDLVDRGGQREIKPTASEISLFLEFGGSKKYPKNWNFEKWNGTSFDDWTAKNVFIPKVNTKQITGYTFANNYYKAIFGADIERKSLHIKQTGGTGTIGNYYTRSHYQSSFEKIPFNEDGATITVQANITTPSGKGLRVVPFIKIPNRNPSQNEYYAISKDGSVSKVGTGSSIDLSKIKPISINNSVDDSAPTDAIEFSWSEDFKIIPSQLNVGRSLNAEASILIFEGRIDSLNENDADIFIHSIQLIFNKNEQAGKGLIFKIKQGGEKFSKSREPETILFSDKINQGVNGYFYNYKYDDTSIVDLPSEFALSSVRERADMFSKARDYYSLDGDFIVNPLAKYKCGLKSFVLVGGENRREDAGIIVEEIVSNTLNRTDFIYTYFDDGKDKVKTIGTASGGSSSSGGGGAVSTPQLWKVDGDGNIYTEYNAYSLKNLSAFGFEDEQGDGDGGGSMDRLDTWASYDASKSGWVLSAFLGNDLNTRVTAIDGRVTDLENSAGSGSVTSVGISVPTGLSVSNSPITSSGVIAIGLQDGYSIPTTAKQEQWDGVVTDFAGLQIGGRNLLLESEKERRVNNTILNIPFDYSRMVGEGLFTISLEARINSGDSGEFDFYFRSNAAVGGVSITKEANQDWERFSHTWELTRIQIETILTISVRTNAYESDILIRNLKIEKGNKATDWSPAPEDQVSDWQTTDIDSFSFIKNKPTTLSGYGITDAYTKTQVDSSLALKLNKLTFDDLFEKVETSAGKWAVKVKYNLFSVGEISAFGLGEEGGGSGGGSMNMMQDWAFTTATENYYLPAKLAVPFYNEARSRLSTLEAGTAPASHTHPISDVTGLQTALNSKLETSIFNAHNNDNVRHITGAERTKWDGVVTDFAGLEIGGRNFLVGEQTNVQRGSVIKNIIGKYHIEFIKETPVNDDHIMWNSAIGAVVDALAGEYVTFSAYYKSDFKGSMRLRNGVEDKSVTLESTNDNWARVTITTKAIVDNPSVWIYFMDYRIFSEYGTFEVLNWQLEKGTIPTDWSPAFEDQVSDWLTTDVNSFSYIKNKPTLLSQFTDNIGVATHIANKANPHDVTKAQVGLSNVDNIQQANKSEFDAFVALRNNPHDVTKAQVGLGNVTNESKATMFTNPTFTGTTKVTILELDSSWKFVKVGDNIELQFDGVTKQIMTDNGDIIATAGVTAYQ